MKRILDIVDHVTKITSVNLARSITRRSAVQKIVAGVVGTVVGMTFFADKSFAAACDKCQKWFVGSWCGCSPPNGKYCSGCGSQASCPSGYKLSKAWGYSSTGCWCSSCSGSSNYYICCDCTRSGNSATKQYSSDCGCRSLVGQSGYCVQ